MAQIEEQFLAEGVEIIWVQEEDTSFQAGTATGCRTFMNQRGSDKGWCVGDGQTMPNPGVFDDSMFAVARGFDMLVDRATMTILYTTSHGTPNGNDNLTGPEVLAEVRRILGR
jgi:hypothetical protein